MNPVEHVTRLTARSWAFRFIEALYVDENPHKQNAYNAAWADLNATTVNPQNVFLELAEIATQLLREDPAIDLPSITAAQVILAATADAHGPENQE